MLENESLHIQKELDRKKLENENLDKQLTDANNVLEDMMTTNDVLEIENKNSTEKVKMLEAENNG